MKTPQTSLAILTATYLLVTARPACAYLDPGTGSMILQFLVAGFLGGLFMIKSFWRQICSFTKGILHRGK